MKTTPTRSILLALALAAVALPAQAAPEEAIISNTSLVSMHAANGGSPQDGTFGGGWNGNPIGNAFNGVFDDFQMYPRANTGDYFLIDFTADASTPDEGMFVTKILIGHNGNKAYTLQYSIDGETWTTIDGADGVKTTGTTTFEVGTLATQVRYVFTEGSLWDSSTLHLAEIQVWGYARPQPQIISSASLVSMHAANGGSPQDGTFGGGWNGNPIGNAFNGVFDDYQMYPRANTGDYFLIDFTADSSMPEGGWYVTSILVGHNGNKAYSLQYSTDGEHWTTVDGADGVKTTGITTNEVGTVATQVRYVFTEGSLWDSSTLHLAEVQVWGMDPADIACTHPSWTEWSVVEGSATCTAKGVYERFCTVCHERQTKASDVPPLGHDYQAHLIQAGTTTTYGSGYIDCSRCDFRIDFSVPVDLTTHGGLAVENLVQFTDLTVTSTDHQEWGPNPANIINGSWNKAWCNYWVSAGMNNQHVDFMFGAEVDLTKVDLSVDNHDHTFQFYAVNDETGEETLIGEKSIVKDNPAYLHVNGDQEWQRLEVFLYDSCKHLRVRTANDSGVNVGFGNGAGMCVLEMHPYGTVVGAGMPEPSPMFLLMQ